MTDATTIAVGTVVSTLVLSVGMVTCVAIWVWG